MNEDQAQEMKEWARIPDDASADDAAAIIALSFLERMGSPTKAQDMLHEIINVAWAFHDEKVPDYIHDAIRLLDLSTHDAWRMKHMVDHPEEES